MPYPIVMMWKNAKTGLPAFGEVDFAYAFTCSNTCGIAEAEKITLLATTVYYVEILMDISVGEDATGW